jgi:hypothetical protein
MASRMAGVGQVTVSERKSILSMSEVYVILCRLQVGHTWPKGWLIIGSLTGLLLLWLTYRWLFAPVWLQWLPPLLRESLILMEMGGGFTLAFLWLVLWGQRWRQEKRDGGGSSAVFTPFPDHHPHSRADLYQMDPVTFEKFVAHLFRQRGYQVKRRGGRGDHGVDLEVRQANGKKAVVQCKRYTNTVGPDVVRELFGTLIHERAAHAFLVTSADISASARQWAGGKPITLIDGPALLKLAGGRSKK